MTWVLDLDGVVWLAGAAIPGSVEAVDTLRAAGQTVVFATNNSGARLEGHVEALARIGISARPEDVTSSAQAAAALLTAGEPAGVVGDAGIYEALEEAGVPVVALSERPGVVVAGRKTALDYDELAAAATLIREGARFVATNTDATFPTGAGLVPGAGAIIAFLATASGRQPEVAGKPHQPSADLIKQRYGHITVMVGDRPDTDGLLAQRIGAPFALVLSGVTGRQDLPVQPAPDLVGDDLADVVRQYLADQEPATSGQGGV